MADSDTASLHPRSSQSGIDEIENLINVSVQPVTSAVPVSSSAIVPVARPGSPPRASIPSKVSAIAFAVLAAGAVVLTLNVVLLGGHIIFFQSLSLLGYCLFPLDVGALICMFKNNLLIKIVVVLVTLAWSSWAAYPFMSAAVAPIRKGLDLYLVSLLYISIGFLIFAID